MKFRVFLLSALLAMTGGIGTAGSSQSQDYAYSITEAQTGIRLCKPSPGNRLATFGGSGIFIDAPNTHCWIWDTAVQGYTFWANRSVIAGVNLPVVVAVRNGKPDPDIQRRIILRVIGGPGARIAPDGTDMNWLDALRPGDVLVTPAYPGTAHGTYYPAENFTSASAHIAWWLGELRRRNPNAVVLLAGESLGAPIALEANRLAGPARADRIVLLSPLAYSSSAAQKNFLSRRGAEYRNDGKKSVRVIGRDAASKRSDAWQSVFSTDLFRTFFAQSQWDIDIATRLEANAQIPVLLVYGSDDWRAGISVIERIRPGPNLRVVKIDGMPHAPGEPHRAQISAALVDFLKQSGQK